MFFHLLTTIVVSLLISGHCWANIDLLKLAKEKKIDFNLSRTCRDFIQSVTPAELKFKELDKYKKKLSEIGLHDYIFYHYTKKNLKKEFTTQKGIWDILYYQFTDDDATDNAVGPALYISANPFSSSEYGKYQAKLELSPNSIVFPGYDQNANAALANIIYGNRYNCETSFLHALILDQNGVDLDLFNDGSQWFGLYNENVILKSEFSIIKDSVTKSILDKKDYDSLIDGNNFEFSDLNADHRMAFRDIVVGVKKKSPQLIQKLLTFAVKSEFFAEDIELMNDYGINVTFKDFMKLDLRHANQLFFKYLKENVLNQNTDFDITNNVHLENISILYHQKTLTAEEISQVLLKQNKLGNISNAINILNIPEIVGSIAKHTKDIGVPQKKWTLS